MSETVRELNRHFIELWWKSDTCLPNLGPRYLPQAQAQNEKRLLEFLDQAGDLVGSPPRSRQEVQAAQTRLGAAFKRLALEALGFTAEQLDRLPSEAFSRVSEEFVRMARAFDPGLSGEDIYQAGRNAWTAHGLQWLLNMPVQVTPSILAYSLLYPYTDNYLDNPRVPARAKTTFNERFRQRLAGAPLAPTNEHEQIIFDLVAMIEQEYSRSKHPAVFESLLEIHEAQARSLSLMRAPGSSDEVDVLGLSFHKGGASVLADGYLVCGSLPEAQRRYTYGHGIFAQLLDDMEDVEQDSRAGRLTMYSQAGGSRALDSLANRTFHFGHHVLMGLDCFKIDEPIQELIRRGADLFLIDAISRSDRYYTRSYLRELEAYSPFRFSFLKQQRDRFLKRYGSQGTLIDMLLSLSNS